MRWDMEADVVVVGFGGGGSAAAITASDLGGDVVVFEKQLQERHLPSTAIMGGGGMFVTSVELGAQYLDACAAGLTPYEVSRAWAEKAADLEAWMNALDPKRFRLSTPKPGSEHPGFVGAETVVWSRGIGIEADGSERPVQGVGLFAALSHAVRSRGIPVHYGVAGRRLVEVDGHVIGLDGFDAVTGQIVRARARRGVVLATGGFEFNEEMKRQFLPVRPAYFYTSEASTGDGILMAQAVGAALWHMQGLVGRGTGHFEAPDKTEVNVHLLLASPGDRDAAGYIITDCHGRRFANEDPQAELAHGFWYHMMTFDPEHGEFPRVPSYWFFDERRRKAGPLTMVHADPLPDRYRWSADNLREIEQRWIASGDTIESTAAAAGLKDPAEAAASVSAYNKGCALGDDAFGRTRALTPIDEPPYYCVSMWPGGTNTSGGPKHDEHGRVVHVFGYPIPGLFAAGEVGQYMGSLYPGGMAYYSDVLCSGRIAGESAMTL
jgi:hypothetical protein